MKTMAEKNDIFELEQGILGAWNVVEELKMYAESLTDFNSSPENLDMDKVLNMVNALADISDLRFHKLWDVFENFTKYHRITKKTESEIADSFRRREYAFGVFKDPEENVENLPQDPEGLGQEKI